MNFVEPILQDDPNRFVLFPVKYQDLYEQFKKHEATLWTAEEIDLAQDLNDWKNRLNDDERHYIKMVLAFFAASDGIVNENLAVNFSTEVQYAEARAYYSLQLFIETIHSEVYSLLIDTYIKDEKEKNHLFNALQEVESVKAKGEWAIKWIKSENFVERLIAFATVEGIMFSGSFAAIFWLKERGLMPGLTFSNELISRDEGLHTDFAVNLYKNHIVNKLSKDRIKEIVLGGVELEKLFVTESLPVELIGMNSKLMCQYIEFVADRLLLDLGVEKHFNVENPFPFMDMINIPNKTNFFEKRVSEYQKAGVKEADSNKELSFDADF